MVMEMFAGQPAREGDRTSMRATQFLGQLAGVTDPEAKRKIIGREFVEVFQAEAAQAASGAKWLAQGTIYPDVIESRRRQDARRRRRSRATTTSAACRRRWA